MLLPHSYQSCWYPQGLCTWAQTEHQPVEYIIHTQFILIQSIHSVQSEYTPHIRSPHMHNSKHAQLHTYILTHSTHAHFTHTIHTYTLHTYMKTTTLAFFWYIAIQSVLSNHLCCLMSATPPLRFPNRLVRSTCSRLRSRSFKSVEKNEGNRT